VKLSTHLHLVPRSRMRGVINPLPQYAFMWCLVKHRDNFTFTFTNFALLNRPTKPVQSVFQIDSVWS